ncbi:hypothetical protein JKP88DRAFT_334936 [Tribonema minus]|uniref:Uncharacterized protein n=1 Tax=Tribonema minus TaxID=303371 RepID=A0A835YJI4_9STRA|nr:hypothetical protein JKP88DRAFT_334936 [Tribonema minus]
MRRLRLRVGWWLRHASSTMLPRPGTDLSRCSRKRLSRPCSMKRGCGSANRHRRHPLAAAAAAMPAALARWAAGTPDSGSRSGRVKAATCTAKAATRTAKAMMSGDMSNALAGGARRGQRPQEARSAAEWHAATESRGGRFARSSAYATAGGAGRGDDNCCGAALRPRSQRSTNVRGVTKAAEAAGGGKKRRRIVVQAASSHGW